MTLDTWIAYLFASSLIAASPGSGAVLSMTHSVSYGLKRTGATILGLEIGLVLILFIAGAGVGALLVASKVAFNTVKILGALYLIYLGWTQWHTSLIAQTEMGNGDTAPVIHTLSWRKRCAIGFLTNATNPKSIVFMVAVLPQFINHSRPLFFQLLIMAGTMVMVDAVITYGYAFSARALQKSITNAKAVKVQNRLFGGILMALGTGLFFVKRGQ